MSEIDFNLLTALDILLAEGSVTRAARRLDLSASAMSRTLTRLRSATGDPLLVRAGRGLVPTPRAIELRDRVHALRRDVHAVLQPRTGECDVATLDRTFVVRAGEGFVAAFASPIANAIGAQAPRVRLRFAPKPEKTAHPLREGEVDLEVGVVGEFAPEVRTQALFRDRFVGFARPDHPIFEGGAVTAERYAECRHVVASRRGAFAGPVDDALAALGLSRRVAVVVAGFPDALRVARRTDLVALAPRSCLGNDAPTDAGVRFFDLPFHTPRITVSAMWHPRVDADPAHRWFRSTVVALCRAQAGADEPA